MAGEEVAGKIFKLVIFFRDLYGNRIYYTPPGQMQYLPGNYASWITTSSDVKNQLEGAYTFNDFNATKSITKLLLNFTISFALFGTFEPQIPINVLPDRPHRIIITSERAVTGMVNEILYNSPQIIIVDRWGNEVNGTHEATIQGIPAYCAPGVTGINESLQIGVHGPCATVSRGLLSSREAYCSSNDRNQTLCHLGAIPASTKVDGLVFAYHGLYRLRVRIFSRDGQYGGVDLAQTSFVIPIAPHPVLRFQNIPAVVAGEKLMHDGQSGVNIRMLYSQDSDEVVAEDLPLPIFVLPVAVSIPPTRQMRSGNSVLVTAIKTKTLDGRPCMSTDVSASGLQCHAEGRLRNVLAGLVNIPYDCSSVNNGYGNVPNGTRCHFPFEFNGSLFTECTRMERENFDSGRSWCRTSPDVSSDHWGECDPFCVENGSGQASGSGHLTAPGDEVEYVMFQGAILFNASIVNVGTYRLYARTANFSDDNAVAGENIFFQKSLQYTWAAGYSREFNVTPGSVSGIEILTEPGDCVLRTLGHTYCNISTTPVVRPVDLFGNGVGDLIVTADVIQIPIFPDFHVAPLTLPDEFNIESCSAFFAFARSRCPMFLTAGESCEAPSFTELVSICEEAFDQNATCFKAISNQSVTNRNETCLLFTRTCDAYGLLPSEPSCFAAEDADASNGSAIVTRDPLCLPGWSEADGSCFLFNSTGTSFAEADEVCKAMTASVFDSRVATISSIAMNHLVSELVGNNSEVYIGLKFQGFGGWSEGYGSLEWVSGFQLNFEADWAFAVKPDRVGRCTRIFGKHSSHPRAWDDHDCDFASQGFVCSYVPMITRMLGGGAIKTSKWWDGGTAEHHGLSIKNLADSMTPSSSFQPSLPTFKALIRFRYESPESGPIFYAGHRLHFVLAKALNITTDLGEHRVKAGQMLPSIDVVLIDLDGGLVQSTDTPVVATLHTQERGPEHPMLGEKQIKIHNGMATFQQLWVEKANSSVFIRFYYVDGMTADTSTFAVVPEDPVQLSIIQQAPDAVTSNVKFQITLALLDRYSNVCPITNAKIFVTSNGVDVFSLAHDTQNQVRCVNQACSYEAVVREPGKWHFDLFVKKAAPDVRLSFRVEEKQSRFPFQTHQWWTSTLAAVSDPFECIRGSLAGLDILLPFDQVKAGVQLPPFTVRLTDAEGNEYDPSANASSYGTAYDPHQVGQNFLVHVRLEAGDGTLLTTSDVTQMDDNSNRTIFSGNMTYVVGHSDFEVSNVTVFRAGSYRVYISINGSDIVERSSELTIYPSDADRLLFDTVSGNIEHTQIVTAGEPLPFALYVVDVFGNIIFNLPDMLSVQPREQLSVLSVRADWLDEDFSVSSWILGQTQAHASYGRFELEFSVQYAGRITLDFAYLQTVSSAEILVNAETPFRISLSTMPTSFKIDDVNLGALPGLPYGVAVLDRFNNTIDVDSINIRLAEIVGSGWTPSADIVPQPCGNFYECKAELCFPTDDGQCESRFESYDRNQDGKWSRIEFTEYSMSYPDTTSATSFESIDVSGDDTISKMEFQMSGFTVTHKAPLFEIEQLILRRPNRRYALLFSSGDIVLKTDSFDVFIGDPYQVRVTTECPESSKGFCGQVGQYLTKSFYATVTDVVGNLRDDLEDVPIVVSIPSAFTTPGAFLQGKLVARTEQGIAVFGGQESIRIDKVPPNPEVGYKLQFDAVMSNFSLSSGTSDFFKILAEEAVTIGFASQIDEGSTFFVFSAVGGESGAARIESRDKFGNLAVDTDDSVFASFFTKGHPSARLLGTTEVRLTDGFANFDNLLVDQNGDNYKIRFCLKSLFSCPESVIGNSFSVVALSSIIIAIEPKGWSYAGSAILPDVDLENWDTSPGSLEPPSGPTVQILDENREPLSTTVSVVASILGDETASLLVGTTTEAAQNGLAQFTNLILQRNGTYQIRFRVALPNSQLAANSQEITIIPSKESELCHKPSDCIIRIVRDPFPVTCDGDQKTDQFGNVIASRDIIVGECFRSNVMVTDAYGNILNSGNVSAQAFLEGPVQPTEQSWKQHLQQRRMLKFIASSESGVLGFIFNIERSCSAADCSVERREGYILEFYKEATTAHTKVFEILPATATYYDFALMNFDALKGVDEVYAGAEITPGPAWVVGIGGPTFFLYDRFGNLATTQTGAFVWNVTYVGPGCMLCDNQDVTAAGIQGNDCEFLGRGIGRTNALSYSVSTCTDLVEPRNGKMQINVSAPTLVVRDFIYTFSVGLRSWDFGVNNLFTNVLTRRFDLLAGIPADVSYSREALLNRVAGELIQTAVAVTDKFGNTVITGCTRTEVYSISRNKVLSFCTGCNQSFCDDCGYEIAEQESELENTHVAFVEVRSETAAYQDLQIRISFFDACSSTQVLFRTTTVPFDIRPSVASQLRVENPTQAFAGSTQFLAVTLLDEFNNVAEEFNSLVATFETRLPDNADYVGCLYCDAMPPCSAKCTSVATLRLGAGAAEVQIPNKASRKMQLELTAILPTYSEWNSVSISLVTEEFQILPGPAASIFLLRAPGNAQWPV